MRLFFLSIALLSISFTFFFCSPSEPNPKTNLISISRNLVSGDTIHLTDYKGKVVIIDFWATWCEPCSKAVPVINRWKKEVSPEDFVFLGVNTDENEKLEKIKTHMKNLQMDYPSILDSDWKLSENYDVDGIPYLLVFDRSGQLVYRQAGLVAADLPGLLLRSKVWVQ